MSFPSYPEYKDSGVAWLGVVPNHWITQKLKRIASFSGGGTPSRENLAFWGGDIPWVSPKDMKSEEITTAEESITALGLKSSATNIIPSGSILLVVRSGILRHTIPISITKNKVALNQDMKAIHFEPGVCLGKFFLRWVQGLNDHLLCSWGKQGATVESIEHEYLSNTVFPLPPLEEQSAIVAFLDHETAKIDALVTEQEKLIELLKEKRQAVISHAVAKGLDPNVPMKDSGVEWLGEVPKHWVVTTLGRITLDKCDGPFGSGLKSEHYTDEGVRVIRLQNIRDGGFDGTDEAFIDETYYFEKLTGHGVVAADVLIAGLGDDRNSVGRACVAPDDIQPALVKADCFRFRVDSRKAVPSFLAHQLTAGAPVDAGRMSSGSTRSRINLSTMATRKVALPPLSEQYELLEWFDSVLGALGALTHEAQRAIDLLKERRSALISAAVTGKIDVRNYTPEVQEVV